jgi:hypothetical protein
MRMGDAAVAAAAGAACRAQAAMTAAQKETSSFGGKNFFIEVLFWKAPSRVRRCAQAALYVV